MSESEYRVSVEQSRRRSDITEKQLSDIAKIMRDYDEQAIKYMLFSTQSCLAIASVPEDMEPMKEVAIRFVTDMYKAIDGLYK